jgi:hypothetical protein
MFGSAVENPKLGQEFLPVLLFPDALCRVLRSSKLIPIWLRWARFICTMTFALRIIMVAEFDRDCGSVRGNENCQDLLENIDAVPEETWWNWIVLVSLFCAFRFTALAILQKRIQVLLSRDQCWSIQELSSCALADSRGFISE